MSNTDRFVERMRRLGRAWSEQGLHQGRSCFVCRSWAKPCPSCAQTRRGTPDEPAQSRSRRFERAKAALESMMERDRPPHGRL